MSERISDDALRQLFLEARTHNGWQERDVDDQILRELVDIVKMGPTSANCQPVRLVFVKSAAAKAKLKPHLMDNNRDKTMAAPVIAIVAHDLEFFARLPEYFPHTDAKSWFEGKPKHSETTAFRNATLQGAYLIIAARALGLDCGPMSGFDNAGIDEAFFKGTTLRSNFLCNLGYGDPSVLMERLPRPDFDDIAEIV